jgi:hypothetical protein
MKGLWSINRQDLVESMNTHYRYVLGWCSNWVVCLFVCLLGRV